MPGQPLEGEFIHYINYADNSKNQYRNKKRKQYASKYVLISVQEDVMK